MAHTPMENLRDKLQVVVDELKDAVPETDQYGYRAAMENVIKDIDLQMLSQERQMVIDAYNDADGGNIFPVNLGEQYFNNKYKK